MVQRNFILLFTVVMLIFFTISGRYIYSSVIDESEIMALGGDSYTSNTYSHIYVTRILHDNPISSPTFKPSRVACNYHAQVLPTSNGSVMSVPQTHSIRSYGGGTGVVQSNVIAGSSVSATPLVAHNNLALPMVNRTSRGGAGHNLAHPMKSTPRAATPMVKAPKVSRSPQAQKTTSQPPRAINAVENLTLGYSAAEQYISRSIMRTPPVVTEGGSWNEWLQEVNGDEVYVDMTTLYDKWKEQQGSGNMPNGGTWEEFMEWFNSDKNTYYRAPIGDGAGWLILLAGIYMIVKYMKHKTNKSIERQ